jgi:F-type H+-transporting ATPase subunit delta
MTNRTAARRYARALFDVALNEKANLQDIERDLAGFVDLCRQHPALQKVLLNPGVPAPRKRAAMTEITARAGIGGSVAKLLALLADRDRLVLAPDILAEYRDRLLDQQKIVRAEITTASALEAERARAIEQSLARATGKTVKVSTKVDPSIIGGLVTRIGSTVYDGSVSRQLEKIRERLEAGG